MRVIVAELCATRNNLCVRARMVAQVRKILRHLLCAFAKKYQVSIKRSVEQKCFLNKTAVQYKNGVGFIMYLHMYRVDGQTKETFF